MDSLFGLDKPASLGEGFDLLVTVQDNVYLAIVKGLLESEEIPFLVKERGSGSSVKILAGFSMYGTDVYVNSENLSRAQELLEVYANASDADTPELEGEALADQEDAGQA